MGGPAAKISQRARLPQGRGRRARPQASNVFSLETERKEGGGVGVLVAASAPLASSARSHSFEHRAQAPPLILLVYATVWKQLEKH